MEAYQRLESSWADFNGLDPAGMVACSSGTSALVLALESMQLPKKAEVLVPDFTMIACPRAISMAGLVPVFVDCDERLLMDLGLINTGHDASTTNMPNNKGYCIIEERGKIEAVMLVHIYGRRCADYLEGSSTAKWGVRQIEDLAEAHGIKPHPSTDAACWSFFKNKIVAGEEGGAVWFRDPQHAKLARQLRSLGFTDAHDFWHVPRGHNYRMSNLHASYILDEFPYWANRNGLPWIENNMYLRREIESWYDDDCPDEWRMPSRDVVWIYDLRLPFSVNNIGLVDRCVKALNAAGISARHSFKPMHLQQEYKGSKLVSCSSRGSWDFHGFTQSARAADTVLYLPVRPGRTTKADVTRSMDLIRRLVDGRDSTMGERA